MTNPKAVRGLTAQTLAAAVVNFLEITDTLSHSGTSGRKYSELFQARQDQRMGKVTM